MRYVVIFLCAILLVQVRGDWEPQDEMCVNKLKLERSAIEPLLEKLIHDLDNDDYNLYSECYWKEYNMMGENGEIYWDTIEEIFEEKLGTNDLAVIIKECKDKKITGNNNGETAVLNQNCIIETAIRKDIISA